MPGWTQGVNNNYDYPPPLCEYELVKHGSHEIEWNIRIIPENPLSLSFTESPIHWLQISRSRKFLAIVCQCPSLGMLLNVHLVVSLEGVPLLRNAFRVQTDLRELFTVVVLRLLRPNYCLAKSLESGTNLWFGWKTKLETGLGMKKLEREREKKVLNMQTRTLKSEPGIECKLTSVVHNFYPVTPIRAQKWKRTKIMMSRRGRKKRLKQDQEEYCKSTTKTKFWN